MKLTLKAALVASAFALVSSVPALADTLNFTLSTPTVSVAPGGSYEFAGTLTAPSSNSGAIYLNGDSYNLDNGSTLDDTDFFVNAPLSLAPGMSFTGNLFNVVLNSSASGSYLGTFSILGGSNSNTFNTLASANFQVNAATAVAATPEPGSWLLLTTGLGAVGVLRRRFSTR